MNKTQLNILQVFAILALKQVGSVFAHRDSSKALCAESNWFLGYNSQAEIYYSAMDVHPTQNYFVVGGSTGLQEEVYGTSEQFQVDYVGIRRRRRHLWSTTQSAIILLYEK